MNVKYFQCSRCYSYSARFLFTPSHIFGAMLDHEIVCNENVFEVKLNEKLILFWNKFEVFPFHTPPFFRCSWRLDA